MRNLKASEIIEAMEIFSEKCKKLDNMRDELLNMFVSLLQRILKDIEKIKEEESIGENKEEKDNEENSVNNVDAAPRSTGD